MRLNKYPKSNPEPSIQYPVARTKTMIKLFDNTCDYCGTCVGVCPENCIELRETKLTVDHGLCTLCRKCIWICPVEALYIEDGK